MRKIGNKPLSQPPDLLHFVVYRAIMIHLVTPEPQPVDIAQRHESDTKTPLAQTSLGVAVIPQKGQIGPHPLSSGGVCIFLLLGVTFRVVLVICIAAAPVIPVTIILARCLVRVVSRLNLESVVLHGGRTTVAGCTGRCVISAEMSYGRQVDLCVINLLLFLCHIGDLCSRSPVMAVFTLAWAWRCLGCVLPNVRLGSCIRHLTLDGA